MTINQAQENIRNSDYFIDGHFSQDKYNETVKTILSAIYDGYLLFDKEDLIAEIESDKEVYDEDSEIERGIRKGLSLALKIIRKRLG